MAASNKLIYVYADWDGAKKPILMGTLTAASIRAKEVFAFEYVDSWLAAGDLRAIDPNLQFYPGKQYSPDDKPNFGAFLDSSPDRWGRMLMKRREAIMARQEERKPKTLFESDFLLDVYDEHRMGGLRFKTEENGNFLGDDTSLAVPPWVSLRDLEYASLQLEHEASKDDDVLKWLNMLIAPGGSLGGARPKASVRNPDGSLWIAKFPSGNDEHDIGAWEMVAFQIAQGSGIKTTPSVLKQFTGRHHSYLTRRFDRDEKGARIHFASAMTLLGYNDGADYTQGASYTELAEYIVQNGSNVNEDLAELWKRIVLNICIKNTDDHLRNHGFILTEAGWTLSPVFDVNPVQQGAGLTLNISEDDNALDLDLALSVIPYFRLSPADANSIIKQVRTATKKWKKIAQDIGIPRREIEMMAPAFIE